MKKNVFKKIINKKNITIAIVILILAAMSGVSIKNYYSSSGNLETRTNDATINTGWDPSGMGVTADDIVKKAIELANNNYTSPTGCIGFVNKVIEGVSTVNNIQSSCSGWQANYKTITINGISAEKALYASTTNTMTQGVTWWSCLGMDASSLKPGDIIIGDGHAMIYLGQANGYGELVKNLSAKYGTTFTTAIGSTGGNYQRTYYRDYTDSQTSSTYWTIDVNGNGNGVRIEDYNWTYASGVSSNLDHMKVYRFKETTTTVVETISGSYHFNIVKKDSEDANDSNEDKKYSEALGGAKFEINQYLNSGNSGTPTATKTVTTTAKNYTSKIFEDTKIDKIGNVYDTYTIKETQAPTGYSLGKNWTIGLRIYKGEYTNNRH